jgi:hypothetical protein
VVGWGLTGGRRRDAGQRALVVRLASRRGPRVGVGTGVGGNRVGVAVATGSGRGVADTSGARGDGAHALTKKNTSAPDRMYAICRTGRDYIQIERIAKPDPERYSPFASGERNMPRSGRYQRPCM